MGFSKDFWVTGSTSVIITTLGFINSIIITRYLGPDGRGKYSVISYVIVFFALILGEGIRRFNTIIIGKDQKSFIGLVKFNLVFLIVLSVLLLSLDTFGSNLLTNFLKLDKSLLSLTLATSFFFIIWQIFQAIFLGFSSIIKYNLVQISLIGFFLLFNFIGIYLFQIGLIEIIVNQLFASFLAILLGLIGIKEYIKKSYEKIRINFIKSLPVISKSTLSAVFIYIILKSDVFIINYFLGSYNAGIYSIGIICSDLFQKLPNVIGPLVLSRTVNDPSNDNFYKVARLVRVTIVLNILLILILVTFGKIIINFLFTEQFEPAYNIILLLIPAFFAFGPGTIVYSFFMGKSFPKIVLVINIKFALLNIIANLIFVQEFGISAAAIISSITYFLWSTSLMSYFIFVTKIKIGELLFSNKEDFEYIKNSLKRKN